MSRIIPARAGFTCGARSRWVTKTDHPRSRGVYPSCILGGFPCPGSSPLARGLQHAGLGEVPRVRIIPARAGFTRRGGVQCPRRRDHPRSRGVYIRMFVEADDSDGSSPLARGLLPWSSCRSCPVRIIPARAGFTDPNAATFDQSSDHPRSRGVYRAVTVAVSPLRGSSPLARGLLMTLRATGLGEGIIPARAGFTGGPGDCEHHR